MIDSTKVDNQENRNDTQERVCEVVEQVPVTFTPKRTIVIPVDEQQPNIVDWAIKNFIIKSDDQVFIKLIKRWCY